MYTTPALPHLTNTKLSVLKMADDLSAMTKALISHGDGYPTVVNHITRPDIPINYKTDPPSKRRKISQNLFCYRPFTSHLRSQSIL
jgi:hypothetical protein